MARRPPALPPSIPTADQLAARDRQLAEMTPGSPAATPVARRYTTERFTVAVLAAFVAAVLAVGAVNGVRLGAGILAGGGEAATRAAAVLGRAYEVLGLDQPGGAELDDWVERTEHEHIGPILVDLLHEPEALSVLTGQRYPRQFEYVQMLYRVIFDREADLGAAGWVSQLQVGRADRMEIVLALCRSHEYVEGGR